MTQRLTHSKAMLLSTALTAAAVGAQKTGELLVMVSAAFSLCASQVRRSLTGSRYLFRYSTAELGWALGWPVPHSEFIAAWP